MENSSKGNFIKSLWILLTFIWFVNWTAFLFVGIKAREKKWLIWSAVYFLTGFVIPIWYSKDTGNGLLGALMWLFFASWIGGIIHGFIIRKEYLLKVSGRYEDSELQESKALKAVKIPLGLSREYLDKINNFDRIIEEIKNMHKSLNQKARTDDRYLILQKFLEDYKEELSVLDVTLIRYSEGIVLISKYSDINSEIRELEEQAGSASEDSKEFLVKTLEEKRLIQKEYDNIKSYLDTSEYKLNYILSKMEKIDVILQSDSLNEGFRNEKSDDLNSKLIIMSDELKATLKSMRI